MTLYTTVTINIIMTCLSHFSKKKYYITDMYIVIMSLWSMIVNIFARLYVQQPRFGARKKLLGLIILYILFVKSERSTF